MTWVTIRDVAKAVNRCEGAIGKRIRQGKYELAKKLPSKKGGGKGFEWRIHTSCFENELKSQLESRKPAENSVVPFEYGNRSIRVMNQDGNPWFVARDVCEILELSDVSMAVSKLDEDEKDTRKVCTLGGDQNMVIISESGLYTLIIRSNKPQAKPFRRWVTGEVLPSIRKTGGYSKQRVNTEFLTVLESIQIRQIEMEKKFEQLSGLNKLINLAKTIEE